MNKVAVGGRYEQWVVKSIEEWADEIGLSPTQAQYASEHARKLGLWETTLRFHRGKRVMHAALTSRPKAVIAGVEGQIRPSVEGKCSCDAGKSTLLI